MQSYRITGRVGRYAGAYLKLLVVLLKAFGLIHIGAYIQYNILLLLKHLSGNFTEFALTTIK